MSLICYNNIYNMDCSFGLDEMSSCGVEVDCVLTSPPYNIIRGNLNDRGHDVYNDGMTNDEYSEDCVIV